MLLSQLLPRKLLFMSLDEGKRPSFLFVSEKIITQIQEHGLQLLPSLASYTLSSFMGGMSYNK
jgi:hypothetical protein